VKDLEDGSKAVGFFNRSGRDYAGRFTKLAAIGVGGTEQVRDLWRQKSLPETNGSITINVPADGVLLLRFTAAR